jgi:hypothetical protein
MSLTLSPGGHPPLSEIALREKLVDILKSDPAIRKTVQIFRSKKEVGTLNALLGEWKFDKDFDVTEEPVLRKGESELCVDLFQGIRPDIVLSSKHSGQNRIIIEAKIHADLTRIEPHESQLLSYFLHLLVTSDRKPKGIVDIPRGFFLAAPSSWFENEKKSRPWHRLVNHYGPLADQFNIILGEIRTDDLV